MLVLKRASQRSRPSSDAKRRGACAPRRPYQPNNPTMTKTLYYSPDIVSEEPVHCPICERHCTEWGDCACNDW